jgi:hypothetical protein
MAALDELWLFFLLPLYSLSSSSSMDKIHQANGCCFFLVCVFLLFPISSISPVSISLLCFFNSALLFGREIIGPRRATQRGNEKRKKEAPLKQLDCCD